MMTPFTIEDFEQFVIRAGQVAARFDPCIILDSCGIPPQKGFGKYKLIIGVGGTCMGTESTSFPEDLFHYWNSAGQWVFGVLGYDLKNRIEKLNSGNHRCFHWPDHQFFIPETVITVSWEHTVGLHGPKAAELFQQIVTADISEDSQNPVQISGEPLEDFDFPSYCETIQKVREEIMNGNVYEMNLCSRFLYRDAVISSPYTLFRDLNRLAPAPFSGFLRMGTRMVLSASPERYLYKIGQTLVSQPIKGTRRRGRTEKEDEELKNDLHHDIKDRAENVMIVDLVRNDLARVSVPGSVIVDELFGIYTFSHVHQMISTIRSELLPRKNWADVLKASFPMGSMTGAPKISAMEHIELFERSDREWYSGAMGYIDPEGNMDFNVLIRSIFYDAGSQNLAYYAGGAITIDSVQEDEYAELHLKASAIDALLRSHLGKQES